MNAWVQLDSMPKGPVTSGQICAVYGVPVDWIVQFPEFNPTTQYLDGDIILAYQKTWLRFAVAGSRKAFKESTKQLKGRTYWEQNLQFRMYWQSGQTDVRVNNMTYHRWVFLFKEGGTGMYYVVGKPPVGAELAVTYSNEQGTVTDFSISYQAIHRAPLYTGVNRSVIRLRDADTGAFLMDAEGNYLCSIGPAVTLPPISTIGDFTTGDFDYTNNDFIVP